MCVKKFSTDNFYSDYGARRGSSQQSPSASGPPIDPLERSLSHSDMPNDKNIGEHPLFFFFFICSKEFFNNWEYFWILQRAVSVI